ncbi:pseudaminic acid biosynthesis-associated methylase [Shewanella canadensis]|uniref:Pseudaminic acid biosynthesis-associated methylase n=1 Tax=Shewanella canadensis TaxID=271096 RepID=A0A431WV51_9GAMM|nr:pseudaminic acid biosynthesis-associated methylase [Shewanella canadensis]RTR39307.1 pseudaminic acid biosynthesis-associated methylase [Shewanella canadensis]
MSYKTEQEKFWAGEFGNNYIGRNKSDKIVAANISMLSSILKKTKNITKIIEFGSNIGLNLEALKVLLPQASLSAIEINDNAVEKLQRFDDLKVFHTSILDFEPEETNDLVLIKGVLIHINPAELNHVYELLYRSSKKYICISEYYNPTPVEVEYRGHKEKLFKRDFAGELMDKYPDLSLVDYGFVYHRDNTFPQDDMTWFLLEKV